MTNSSSHVTFMFVVTKEKLNDSEIFLFKSKNVEENEKRGKRKSSAALVPNWVT